jgi:hypothetical protein
MGERTYFGVALEPANERARACGVRWEARIGNGKRLCADTLRGIKQLVKKELGR